jgi:probable HAF family extracellular repeat protein
MSLKKLFVFFALVFTFLFVAAPQVQACDYRYLVGRYKDSGGLHGFWYKECDTCSDTHGTLDYTDAVWTWARGVNEDGEVVGEYEDSSGDVHGFYWDGSDYESIDYPNAEHTRCIDINNDGYIVGHYENSYGENFGFLYDGNNFTPIGVHFIPDADPFETFCCGINDSEEIVGRYIDSSGDSHGYLYDGTNYYSYDYPGATWTSGRGISSDDIIVGYYSDSNDDWHGYKFDGDLNFYSEDFDSIDISGAKNTVATGISDDGLTIVGYYNTDGRHGFILENGNDENFDFPGTGVLHTRLMDITDWF